MTARRTKDFDLATALRDPGFTPRQRDRDSLVDLIALGTPDDALVAERALSHLGVEGAMRALARVATAVPPGRGRLVHAAGRVAATVNDPVLWDALRSHLRDQDLKTRRNAVLALSRAEGHPGVEADLLARWSVEDRVEMHRSLATALGRVGGTAALALLQSVRTDDGELTRLISQAVVTLERTLKRPGPSQVAGAAVSRAPMEVVLRCRGGLEDLCAEEFDGAWAPAVLGDGRVKVTLAGPLSGIFRSRVMTWFGFPLPTEAVKPGEDVGDTLARVLTGEPARRVLRAFTQGTVRYRIAWADGGHRRASVWRCAAAVTARAPDLVNDPRDSTWEAVVTENAGALSVVLEPRRLDDPRFAYRVGEVPGGSHPTVAAALAALGGARRSDVAWDPFAGAGLELVERARLGDFVRLVGTDLDPRAVEAAQKNLAAAGVTGAEMHRRDAFDGAPEGLTLVITNPPMGYRVGFGEDVGGMLERFVTAVAGWLRPGGRMVWLSPIADRTAAAARRAGLRVVLDKPVELGGFSVRMQRLDRPFTPSRR